MILHKTILIILMSFIFLPVPSKAATVCRVPNKAPISCETHIQLLDWDGEIFEFNHFDLKLLESECKGFKLKCLECGSPARANGQSYADVSIRWMVISFYCTNPYCKQYTNAPVFLDYPPVQN